MVINPTGPGAGRTTRAIRRSPSGPLGRAVLLTEFAVESLAGGTRLTAVPLPGRTSVAVAFMVAVGSRHEQLSNSGISHFVEHMVFKGGDRYPTARDVSIAIEGVGGVLNAATDREATVFWTRVPGGQARGRGVGAQRHAAAARRSTAPRCSRSARS